MKRFQGFPEQEKLIPIPDTFFRGLLAEIDDLDELKVTLHALWRIGQMEGTARFLRLEDFAGITPDPAAGLEKAVQRGSLLLASPASDKGEASRLYFLNSPRGRVTAESYRKGQWKPGSAASVPPPERPNIFKLYEENIGPLTPLVADALRDAEQTYPLEWIQEALQTAVLHNKRSWKYVEAILKRWKEEGHAQEQDRRDNKELRGRDVSRKVEEFLKR